MDSTPRIAAAASLNLPPDTLHVARRNRVSRRLPGERAVRAKALPTRGRRRRRPVHRRGGGRTGGDSRPRGKHTRASEPAAGPRRPGRISQLDRAGHDSDPGRQSLVRRRIPTGGRVSAAGSAARRDAGSTTVTRCRQPHIPPFQADARNGRHAGRTRRGSHAADRQVRNAPGHSGTQRRQAARVRRRRNRNSHKENGEERQQRGKDPVESVNHRGLPTELKRSTVHDVAGPKSATQTTSFSGRIRPERLLQGKKCREAL